MRSERKREIRSCRLVYRHEAFEVCLEGSRELWRISNQEVMSGLPCAIPTGFSVEKGLSGTAGVTTRSRNVLTVVQAGFLERRLWEGTVRKWVNWRGISEVEVTTLVHGV